LVGFLGAHKNSKRHKYSNSFKIISKMAEFMSTDEAKGHFASKGIGNAGLTLGIIGTALGAMNSGFFGNGIFGLGGWNGNAASSAALTGAAVGASIADTSNGWNPSACELTAMIGTQGQDLLRTVIWAREKDYAEKADIYRQSKTDNNRLENIINTNKDLATQAIADTYLASVRSDAEIVNKMNDNRLEAYKNTADLYALTVSSDKNLELQIEKNREIDQAEKFQLYKELNNQTTALAYKSMEQAYQTQLRTAEENKELYSRISALESKAAVNEATIPLYFQLANQTMLSTVEKATCKKVDGNLTIDPTQICLGTWGGGLYSPLAAAAAYSTANYGCGCGGSATI
jgi:hypothetical protein